MLESPKDSDDGIYLEDATSGGANHKLIAAGPNIRSLPVVLTISVGTAKMTIGQLLASKPDDIVALNSAIDDPVELIIGGRVIARGELVELEGEKGQIGVKIIALADSAGEIA